MHGVWKKMNRKNFNFMEIFLIEVLKFREKSFRRCVGAKQGPVSFKRWTCHADWAAANSPSYSEDGALGTAFLPWFLYAFLPPEAGAQPAAGAWQLEDGWPQGFKTRDCHFLTNFRKKVVSCMGI